MHNFADIAGAVVTVALVTTLVVHPGTAKVISAAGGASKSVLLAAEGFSH